MKKTILTRVIACCLMFLIALAPVCSALGTEASENLVELYINQDSVDDALNNNGGTVEGYAVTYNYLNPYRVYMAFYEAETGKLLDVVLSDNVLSAGNNRFTIELQAEDIYPDAEIKYFLWRPESPVALTEKVNYYRTETFSDELEPYYPMITAQTKSAEEIYQSTLPTAFSLTDKQKSVRRAVVTMYRDAGFDISWGIKPDGTNDESRFQFDIPTRYSRLTPKSLIGEYEQPYSIDACFNRKIPDNNPMVELNDEVFGFDSLQLGTLGTVQSPNGTGTGIARIIGTQADPVQSVMSQWDSTVYSAQTLFERHIPSDADERMNLNPSSDRHVLFIDDTNKTVVQTYKSVPPNGNYEYDFNGGRIPGYDISSMAAARATDLAGIGEEGMCSTYATGIPADGMTIKPQEISNPDVFINHALSAAINPCMFGRVYPAMKSDAGGINDIANIGAVPEGGLIRLDPTIDLKALYDNGKLSLPAYKILKAMQEYGLYNADKSGPTADKGVLIYTSTEINDWLNENDTTLNVPFKAGAQGTQAVSEEIVQFMAGNEFFGISKPKIYCTIPVVKYAELDINSDGIIDMTDRALVEAGETAQCDVNCDDVIDYKDVRVYDNYFADSPQHKNEDDLCSIIIADNEAYAGNILVSGAAFEEEQKRKFNLYGYAWIPDTDGVWDMPLTDTASVFTQSSETGLTVKDTGAVITSELVTGNDFALESTLSTANWNEVGLVFNYSDKNNFSEIIVGSGRVYLVNLIAGVQTKTQIGTTSVYYNTPKKLKIVRKDGVLTVYTDGVEAAVATDTVNISGKLGACVRNVGGTIRSLDFTSSTQTGVSQDFTDYSLVAGKMYKVKKNSIVTLSAVAYPTYEFEGWTGDLLGEPRAVTFRINDNLTVGAQYNRAQTYPFNLTVNGNGRVLVSTNGRDYYEPSAEYYNNQLLYLKAVADDGYVIKEWGGVLSGYSEIQTIAVNGEINVTVDFARGYVENYSQDSWECITDGVPAEGAYRIDEQNKQIYFDSFDYSPEIINTRVDLNGDWELTAQVNNVLGSVANAHSARIIFGYQSPTDYYYFHIGGSGGDVQLKKKVSANKRDDVVIATYSGDYTSGGVEYSVYPIAIQIKCKNGKVSISGFKNNTELKYFENIEGAFDGQFGVMALAYRYLYFTDISATGGVTIN